MDRMKEMKLKYIPFEPAASSIPVTEGALWVPNSWRKKYEKLIAELKPGRGPKAFIVYGEYGSGKTYILNWLYRELLPEYRIKPFFFDEPGVQFYDIANKLLDGIGRKDFAKFIWEIAQPFIEKWQASLLGPGFDGWLALPFDKKNAVELTERLAPAIKKTGITEHDEIAYRLAKLVAETKIKHYFDYREFVAGRSGSLVAEKQEAQYFRAILKILREAFNVEEVAFLIDEFEEIGLKKRLTTRQASEYIFTLKRLASLSEEENFWLVLAMTPEGLETTRNLEASFHERLALTGEYAFEVPQLNRDEAKELIIYRLNLAREKKNKDPYPFPKDINRILGKATLSSPRKLVRTCFYVLSKALAETDVPIPFNKEFIKEVETKAYPPGEF